MLAHDHFIRTTISEVYARYLGWCGGRAFQRSEREIETAIIAAGLPYEDAGSQFFDCLRPDWLAGEQDLEPFSMEAGANAEYRFLAHFRGLLPCCLACAEPLDNAAALFCDSSCRADWQYPAALVFMAPPLLMPVDVCAAFIRSATGEALSTEADHSLRQWLDENQ